MRTIERAAVIGGGLIGASWAALFLSRGIKVAVFDPADPDGSAVRAPVAKAWPALQELGLADDADPDAITAHGSAAAAALVAKLAQASAGVQPQRLDQHGLFAGSC